MVFRIAFISNWVARSTMAVIITQYFNLMIKMINVSWSLPTSL